MDTNGFEQFASPEALADYLVAQALEQYSFLFGRFAGFIPVPMSESGVGGVGNEDITNNQVDGVDEADLVETDGEFLYQVNGQTLTVVDVSDASDLEVVFQGRLPAPWLLNGSSSGTMPVEPLFPIGGPVGSWSNIDGIYLQDDRLTIISSGYGTEEFPVGAPIDVPFVEPAFDIYLPPGQPQVQVTVLDVSDPTKISILESSVIEGNLISSRAIGDEVFVATNSGLLLPAPLIIEGTYETEAEYLERIEGQILDLALPNIESRNRPGQPTDSELLSDPTDIYTPLTNSFYQQLTTVSTFDVGDDNIGADSAISITTESVNEIFSSVENLYLLRQSYATDVASTQIWQIDLDTSKLLAFGEVPGIIDNQFSVDEDNGFLRISTTTGFGESALNNVYILDQEGPELNVVGSIEGLAPGERIFSTRFDGDYGFVVTFRQVDPLFTLDLHNPEHPRVAGELKLPGFSEYLQVIEQGDQSLLLGIGLDADPNTGIQGNLKVSLFDVTDLESPVEIDSFVFEGDFTSSEALWDHQAIRYVPNQKLLAIPTQIYDESTFTTISSLSVFEIDGHTGIDRLGTIEQDRAWINRSLSIQGDLYAVSSRQISSHSVPALSLLSAVDLTGEPDYLTWSASTLLGTEAADTLVGDEFRNIINGQGGNDSLAGGLGDDTIFGGQGDDVLRGDLNSRDRQDDVAGGNDIIFGGEGSDLISGKSGNDILSGDAGDDMIWGDAGDDILMGVTGNDILVGDNMSGDSGSDLFIFGNGDGTDTILDFEVGRDLIGLVAGELMFTDLTLTQDGANTLLGVTSSGEVLSILNGVQASALGESDFVVVPDVSNPEEALALV
ncbi:MAG: beta-propeller domain-containing protein [Cyanobacteria bacterium P01_B01_bin.77]